MKSLSLCKHIIAPSVACHGLVLNGFIRMKNDLVCVLSGIQIMLFPFWTFWFLLNLFLNLTKWVLRPVHSYRKLSLICSQGNGKIRSVSNKSVSNCDIFHRKKEKRREPVYVWDPTKYYAAMRQRGNYHRRNKHHKRLEHRMSDTTIKTQRVDWTQFQP